MTTLQLFPHSDHQPRNPPEWGTGNPKGFKANAGVPQGPTWHQKEVPVQQFYTLTQLKKSNVRLNDQLVPEPRDIDMGKLMIEKKFPAEHPYSSHTSRLAVFPTFDSPEDADRGIVARRRLPIGPETPANNYDVQIVHKVKGFRERREIQQLPPESKKRGLVWKGELGFDQVVKPGDADFYPWPPKTVCPNLQQRDHSQSIGPETARTLRNIERHQRKTTYELAHTSSGHANALDLSGKDMPETFTSTFDPAQPVEGRLARQIAPYHPAPPVAPDSWPVKSKPTLHELEEDRLFNGTTYKSYPEGSERQQGGDLWTALDNKRHPDEGFGTLHKAQEEGDAEDVPEVRVGRGGPAKQGKTVTFLDEMRDQQHDRNQAIEAQNRFQVLELQQPQHDIAALNHKYSKATPDEHPGTFYGHEGEYNEERAALYNTTYDPYKQYQSMNERELSGDHIMDTRTSHVDALYHPTEMNYDVANSHVTSKTKHYEQPHITGKAGRVSPREPHTSYKDHRSGQKAKLQPTVLGADDRVQEDGFIQRDSTYGDDYSTRTFLQENCLDERSRTEPMILMSTQNPNLGNIKQNARPKLPKSKTSLNGPMKHGDRSKFSYNMNGGERPLSASCKEGKFLLGQRKDKVPSVTNQFASNSCNIAPAGMTQSWADASAYGKQFPAYDLTYKHDRRFDWGPGRGIRPQTDLLAIQNSFTKTDARKKFHSNFPEDNPDLRENIDAGKQHEFNGMNAQVLHG